jgi:flagellar hook-basal body complex protein FliE
MIGSIGAIGAGAHGIGLLGGRTVTDPSGGGTPFSGVLQGLVAGSAVTSKKAEQAVMGLLNGSGVDVHEAMIATQKADIAFELALQVRNKAVGAYQQMMSMQF